MARAFAIKAVAILLCVAGVWLAPPAWHLAIILGVVAATIAFFTYAIASPHSQVFARVVDRLPTRAPVVALTFDDGPDPVVTPQVLDLLASANAHATFFVLGARAALHPELVARMHREGHAVGTHTQHHTLKFHFGSTRYIAQEIQSAIDEVAKVLPAPPTLFRPPQGLRTPHFSSGWARMRGLVCVTWTVRGLDSLATTADRIVARVVPRLAPGAIVTLHDGTGLGGGTDRAPTLAALRVILERCAALRLRCVSLADPVAEVSA